MNRLEKASLVGLLQDNFSHSQAAFLVGYQGLTVAQLEVLRREVRAKGGAVKVAKNRLVRRAIADMDGTCELSDHLKNQLGVVFAGTGFTDVAKVLINFSKENGAFSIVAGCLESELLSKEKIVRLAMLPSKEILLAQMCGTIKAPVSNLVSALNMIVLKPLWALKQIEAQKQ
jgi:large subunit ribosomal protein L10